MQFERTTDSDTVSTYQVSSVQLVTDKKLELSTNQNVPPFSPASFAINTSPSTPGFILAITPDES